MLVDQIGVQANATDQRLIQIDENARVQANDGMDALKKVLWGGA